MMGTCSWMLLNYLWSLGASKVQALPAACVDFVCAPSGCRATGKCDIKTQNI